MTTKKPIFDLPAIEALLEVVSDGIWFWHADTGYVYRSPSWYRMLGYDPHSLENTVFTWENVIHPDDYPHVMTHFEQYTSGTTTSYDIEYRCRTRADGMLWIRDKALIVDKSEDGSVLRMIGAHKNIDADKRLTELSQYEKHSLQNIIDSRTAELSRLNKKLAEKVAEAELNATTDYLTTLTNRFSFEQRLGGEIARVERFKEPLSLIVLDLDNFKRINDRYGHPTGDEVLLSVGKVLLNNVRQIDVASRLGGDEFALLLPNTALDQAFSVAEKLRAAINSALKQLKQDASASFGVVTLAKGESQIDFLRRADNALYASKNSGRNKVSVGS